ncbi:MAG: lamin tail domain-containing protein [Anaerolineae bacterium]
MKGLFHKLLLAVLLASLFVLSVSNALAAEAGKVFFSAYVEGSSYNKAVAIFNGYGVDLDLSNYQVLIYFNGNTSVGNTITLNGTLGSGEVFVLAHSSAEATLLSMADMTSGSLTFNGDDAVVLSQIQDQSGTTINQPMDIIGQIGFDPGSEWGTGDTSTANNTLYRNATVSVGDMDGSDAFDPSVEWTGAPEDTFTGIDAFVPVGWTPNVVTFSGLSVTSPFTALAMALVATTGLVILRKRK